MYIGKNVNILNLKKGNVVIEKLNIARTPDTIPKNRSLQFHTILCDLAIIAKESIDFHIL